MSPKTTDLCPAGSAATTPAERIQQPGSPMLYQLADDLVSLLLLREEMAENKEATGAVDDAIAEYMAALPQKVDAVTHVIQSFDNQSNFASEEIDRLKKRRDVFTAAASQLRRYCCDVISRLPAPKRGARKLEGNASTLVLKTNGGLVGLDIYDESLIPDEYQMATVTMRLPVLNELIALEPGLITPDLKVTVAIDNDAVRETLTKECWVCEGKGGECSNCGGTGKESVPGARLKERGQHLEIK